MIEAIINKIPTKTIKDTSELKQIEGEFNTLTIYSTSKGDIILRDAQEIVIPKEYGKQIISELHSTHLSMSNLAKGKCYWPGMREELKNIYKACEACLENAISKPSPKHKVIPSSLHLLEPNKIVHLDYLEINGINILVLKCKGTGWNWARVTPDKTAETTTKMFERYITSYDCPRLIVTALPSQQHLWNFFLLIT